MIDWLYCYTYMYMYTNSYCQRYGSLHLLKEFKPLIQNPCTPLPPRKDFLKMYNWMIAPSWRSTSEIKSLQSRSKRLQQLILRLPARLVTLNCFRHRFFHALNSIIKRLSETGVTEICLHLSHWVIKHDNGENTIFSMHSCRDLPFSVEFPCGNLYLNKTLWGPLFQCV